MAAWTRLQALHPPSASVWPSIVRPHILPSMWVMCNMDSRCRPGRWRQILRPGRRSPPFASGQSPSSAIAYGCAAPPASHARARRLLLRLDRGRPLPARAAARLGLGLFVQLAARAIVRARALASQMRFRLFLRLAIGLCGPIACSAFGIPLQSLQPVTACWNEFDHLRDQLAPLLYLVPNNRSPASPKPGTI